MSPSSDRTDARFMSALAGVHASLARLRLIDDVAALIHHAPQDACDALGFERAILFRIAGDVLLAEAAFERRAAANELLLLAGPAQAMALADLPFESEMIRRREPLLPGDAVYHQLTSAPRRGRERIPYVSAPIISEGRVVGFLQADREGQDQTVDELDQMLLAVFTEGFACTFERATLRERLRSQLAHVREVMDTTDQLLDEVIETEIEVGMVEQRSSATVDQWADALGEPSGPVQPISLLTPREVDVIELIAAGETNAGIANRLLISESTVKSHVKHILRKLGASHRAEAVSVHLSATGRR